MIVLCAKVGQRRVILHGPVVQQDGGAVFIPQQDTPHQVFQRAPSARPADAAAIRPVGRAASFVRDKRQHGESGHKDAGAPARSLEAGAPTTRLAAIGLAADPLYRLSVRHLPFACCGPNRSCQAFQRHAHTRRCVGIRCVA